MVRRANREDDLRTPGETEWRDADDEEEAWRDGRSRRLTLADERPGLSLARRLERDQRLVGRVAHWLFIKGGMVVLLIVGLIVLGLVAGFVR
jgi:hypothetical protein